MASVVFFRAANVGGHQIFQPGLLAKELAEFGVVNLGAAGTFVVRGNVSPTRLRDGILRQLPFKPEMMICPATAVADLMDSEPFRDAPAGRDVTQYVSVLSKPPHTSPPCPLAIPTPTDWEVFLHRIVGQFVFCVQRPGKKKLYPNAVVEKHLGLPATTRNWNTFVKIGQLLEDTGTPS